ncbi:MAG: hypothetical protein IPN69_08265 [Acidobacteria bacterium]|nr:hypothetical protein [Acidobacteriota bacterium]
MSKPTVIVKNEKISVVSRGIQGPAGITGPAGPPGSTDAGDITNFAATVRATTLTGLAAGSNQAIAGTDTILQAFANLQAQISGFSGMAIGGTIGGSPTAGSVLFVGAGGVLANDAALKWDVSALALTIGDTSVSAGRAWIAQRFPGENIAALFSGLVTPATNNYAFAAGGTVTFINFGPTGQLTIRSENVPVAECGGSTPFTFYAKDANRTPLAIKGASSQTANLFEWKNNSDAVFGALNASGDLYLYDRYIVLEYAGSARGYWHPVVGGWTVNSGFGFMFTASSGGVNYADTGLFRAAAAIVKITDASSGGGALQLQEMSAPSAPAANNVIVFAEDNGSGKTRLMARFSSGAAQQIAIEP